MTLNDMLHSTLRLYSFNLHSTVSHTTKQLYWYMSQYSSTQKIIANVMQLLKWRNIKHTDALRTNTSMNSKTTYSVWITYTEHNSSNYLHNDDFKQYVFLRWVFRLYYPPLKNHTTHYIYNIFFLLTGPIKFSKITHHMCQFQKKDTEYKKLVLDRSIIYLCTYLLKIIFWYIIRNIHWIQCKAHVILSDCNNCRIFYIDLLKYLKIFHKTHPATEGMFRGDRQNDGRKDKYEYYNSAFSQFFLDFNKIFIF